MVMKLTLQVDANLIESAQRVAQERGTTVSRLVADYFAALDRMSEADSAPISRSLRGVAAGANMDEEDYRRYQEDKHR